MTRPVAPKLTDHGLLVGWSLEGERRKQVIGFAPTQSDGVVSEYLEPILHTGEGHLITVAPTGAGKGVGCIIPALLRYPGPVIVIDPKGENYQVTARRRRELGQKVIALDPFKIADVPESDRGRFNPLDFLSPDNPSLVEDVEMIATTLMASLGTTQKDPFWPFMGGQLIAMVLLHQIRNCEPAQWTLTHTRELLSKNFEEFVEFGNRLRQGEDADLRRMAGISVNPSDDTFGGYWAFSNLQTAFLKGEMIAESTGSSTFSLQELVDGDPLSIYIIIPPEKLEAYGNLLKVWLTVMMSALTSRRTKPALSTLFILDEAAQLGAMPQLRQAVTLLRGYGVRVWSFWQDLSQLQGLYPDTWPTILNNCHVQQYFGQVTRMGSAQTYEACGLGSPEYLQSLERGEMVLSVLGDQPVIARVPNYRDDAPFKGLYDANTMYTGLSKQDGVYHPERIFRRSDFSFAPSQQFQEHTELAKELIRAQRHHPVADHRWTTITEEEQKGLFAAIREAYDGLDRFNDANAVSRRCDLSFYKGMNYYEVRVHHAGTELYGYFVFGAGEAIFLDGGVDAILRLNERLDLNLQREQIQEYLFFFVSTVEGSRGRFLIVDDVEDLSFKGNPNEQYLNMVKKAVTPVSVPQNCLSRKHPGYNRKPTKLFRVVATVLYDNSLLRVFYRVHWKGHVEMVKTDILLQHMPVIRDTELKQNRFVLARRGLTHSIFE